jgi:hypothetical protein
MLPMLVLDYQVERRSLPLDATQIELPRAGIIATNVADPASPHPQWIADSARLIVRQPARATIVRLLLSPNSRDKLPVKLQIGSAAVQTTLAPQPRHYAFLLPETAYEQNTIAIDATRTIGSRGSHSIILEQINVAASGHAPAIVPLGLALATIASYILLRSVRISIRLTALICVIGLAALQGWHLVGGWRFAGTGLLALLIAGISGMSLILERFWLAQHLPPSPARAVAVATAALACAFLPGVSLHAPGLGPLLLGIALVSMSGYLLLRLARVPALVTTASTIAGAGLLFAWYMLHRWEPGPFDTGLLLVGTVALLVVGICRWRTPLPAYAALASITILLLLIYASQYFFIMDDYALVDGAQQSLSALFTSGIIGFYRPVVFVLLKLEYLLYGWQTPAGYLAFSVLGHSINACLVGIFAHRVLRLGPATSTLAAALFLLSPWASETLFWMSCQFDIIATAGILTTLLLALHVLRTPLSRARYLLSIAAIAIMALVSLGAKETAVTLPALFVCCVVMTDGWRRAVLSRSAWFIGGLLVAAVALVLVARGQALQALGGAFGGAYGNYFKLLGSISSINVTHAISDPPGVLQPSLFDTTLHTLYIAALLTCCAAAVCLTPRRAIALILAFGVAVLPVLFVGQLGGRLMYMPGVWLVLLICTGVAEGERRLAGVGRGGMAGQFGMVALALVMCVYGLSGVMYQERVWTQATDVARQAIQLFGVYKERNSTFQVKQLPFHVSGAYILKSYAFPLYFQKGIDVQAERAALAYQQPSLLFNGKFVRLVAKEGPVGTVLTFDVRDIE